MEKPLDPFDVPYNPKYVFDADDDVPRHDTHVAPLGL